MPKTHVILDALQDPAMGRELSARWAKAGIVNTLDVAGQCATLETPDDDAAAEGVVARAAAIARAFGVELRDRAGATFVAANELPALRKSTTYEYRLRLASALVYGLPALAIHYAAPYLAGGSASNPRGMLYPWLFEMLLAGWVLIAAGWPILWQGVLSLVHLRITADLFTTVLVAASFIPSAIVVLTMPFVDEPLALPRAAGGTGVMFQATVLAVTLAVAQRWRAHGDSAALSGGGARLPRRLGVLLGATLIVAGLVGWFGDTASPTAIDHDGAIGGWRGALAVLLVLPPMIGLGGVNRWSPGASIVLPVIGFGLFLLLGGRGFRLESHGMEIEIAGSFQAMMTLVLAWGWRGERFAKAQSLGGRT